MIEWNDDHTYIIAEAGVNHNGDVNIAKKLCLAAKEAGADVEILRAMGGSANSLLWTQIKSDITGKPIVVPSSDTATTLGAAILAGIGVGMYKDYDEAISLTVKETRRHEPNPDNRAVYEKTYKTYLNLYKSLEPMMRNEEEK